MKESVPPVEKVPVYCVDCLQEICMEREVGTVLCYYDSRLNRWVCPACWHLRKALEERRKDA